MHELKQNILSCKVCESYLSNGVRPIFAANPKSKIVIIGQAPGSVVHQTGIPWDDKSGDNLRSWLGVSKAEFYNEEQIVLIPMGFCYPGKGRSGDLPPRPECAPLWHRALLEKMPEIQLSLLIGTYAQKYYLGQKLQNTLTKTVQNYQNYLPYYFVLPHPSPRNNIWQAKNPWFQTDVIPELWKLVGQILHA